MDRYTRRQYFEGLCRLRGTYATLQADDTTSCISIEDVIDKAIELLESPLAQTEADEAHRAA